MWQSKNKSPVVGSVLLGWLIKAWPSSASLGDTRKYRLGLVRKHITTKNLPDLYTLDVVTLSRIGFEKSEVF